MRRIYCIGEMLIDFICKDNTNDLSKGINFEKKAGGAPANVAAAVSKLGGNASFMGMVGEDPFGIFLEDTLKSVNVDTSLLKRRKNTTLAFVSIDEKGERDFKFMRGADGDYSLKEEELELLEKDGIVHFGSATGFLDGELKKSYYKFLHFAKDKGMFISFDPNYRDALISNFDEIREEYVKFMSYADFVKLSDDEARLITKKDGIEEAALELLKYGDFILCITMGASGTFLAAEGRMEIVPTIKIKQVDSTGAGDAFVGAMLYKLSQEVDLRSTKGDRERLVEYTAFANRVGAFTCINYGAISSMPSKEQLE